MPRRALFAALISFLGMLAAGCGDAEVPVAAPGCVHPIGDACAGVSSGPICDDSVCTADVACATVVEVHDDASLITAMTTATSGTCIAPAPGDYLGAILPGGVSLLGKGSDFVHVGAISLGPGSGAVVRGIGVGTGGISLDAAQNARIEAVRVADSLVDGISVGEGSSVAIVGSEISSASGYGIRATNPGSVSVETTAIVESAKTGFWASCAQGCNCPQPPEILLDAVVIEGSGYSGVSLKGVAATLTGVDVGGTHGYQLSGGGGLSAWGCTTLDATGLAVHDSRQWGVLVDDSTANFGAPGDLEEKGMIIYGNVLGLWVQNQSAGQQVVVENASFSENSGAGIGTGGEDVGMIIYGTVIKDTASATMPVSMGGSKEVGHGLVWSAGSRIEVDGLTVSGSAHQSILIDGAVGTGSSIANVTLGGGDESKGIVQQNFSGGETPALGGGAPPVQQSAGTVDAVPLGPITPSEL